MNVILWIIGIIFVISIITEIIKGIGESIGKLIGGIVIIIFAIVAIRFLIKSLNWLVDELHYLICLVPKGILYAYIGLFLAVIIVWLSICILNISLIYAIEDVLYTYCYFGTSEDIKRKVKAELLQNHSGIMALTINSKRYDRLFRSILADSSYVLKKGYCTYAVFEEWVGVLDRMGFATDKEMIDVILSTQEYSAELIEISQSLDDYFCGLSHMVRLKRAELVPLNQDDEEEEEEKVEYYEPKLYKSTNPSPSPENMLPPIEIDMD